MSFLHSARKLPVAYKSVTAFMANLAICTLHFGKGPCIGLWTSSSQALYQFIIQSCSLAITAFAFWKDVELPAIVMHLHALLAARVLCSHKNGFLF